MTDDSGRPWLTKELKFALLAWSLRAFVLGYTNIVYGIYLSKVGLGAIEIGLILTVASIVNTILMGVVAFLADKHGKTKIFIILGVVTALASIPLALTEDPLLIVAISLTGMTTVGAGGFIGGGGGPLNVLQEAIVAENVSPERRNTAFSLNYFLSSITAAGGALLAGLPPILEVTFGLGRIRSFSPLFAITVLLTVLMLISISKVSEKRGVLAAPRGKRSGKIITRYSLIQATDGFGTALVVGNILSYWFFVRFNAGEDQIAILFSAANLIAAFSYLLASRIANRIGAVRTVVLTHLPTNFLLLAIPAMPSFALAAVIYLIKSAFDKMDIPIRSSYIMGVVRSEDRVLAAGVAGVARRAPASLGPAITGYLIQSAAFSSPFVISTAFQSITDIGFYLTFRKIRPPEEKTR